jgi:hypothetical protein
MAVLDDDHLVGVTMAPAVVPTAMMLAEFGTRVVVAVLMTAFDHHRLGACNRRRRNRDRAKSSKNVTKLLHVVLSSNKREIKRPDERNVPQELEENSEQLFSKWLTKIVPIAVRRRVNPASRLAQRVQAAHHRRIKTYLGGALP